MPYLSLYRKYRSQSFGEVSGQDHVTRTLQNAIRADRVAHAYLFCGARGTGKTTMARLLAKCLNCERGPTPEPCNVCDNCLRIRDGSSMDVIEIDAASNRGIDEIRTLREKVQYSPSQSRKKVYVLDEVHMLTSEAFNALLKTLEEPPGHVVFILATTEAHKIPATILSRCQRFDFRRGSLAQIGDRLRTVAEQEGYAVEPAAIERIARGAGGSWRDALSLLEQVLSYGEKTITAADVTHVLGTVDADALHALAEAVRVSDGAALFGSIEELIAAGKDARQLTRDLVEHFRALLLAAVGAAPATDEAGATLAQQAAAFGIARLVRSVELLAQVEKDARWSDQSRLALEVALVRLMRLDEPAGRASNGVTDQGTTGRRGDGVVTRRSTGAGGAEGASWGSVPGRFGRGADSAGGRAPGDGGQGVRESATAVTAPGAAAAVPQPATAMPRPASAATSVPPPAAAVSLPADEEALPDPIDEPPPLREAAAAYDPFTEEALEVEASTAAGGPAPSTPAASQRRVSRGTPSGESSSPDARSPEVGVSAPSGASPDLAAIQARWLVVVEELKRRKAMTAHALLSQAAPARLDGETLVVRFEFSSHVDLFQRGDGRQQLEAALLSVFGTRYRVQPEAGKGEGGDGGMFARTSPVCPTRPAEPGRPLPEPPPDAASEEPAPADRLVHDVIAIFNGKILDEDASP